MKSRIPIARLLAVCSLAELLVAFACVDTTPVVLPDDALDGGADAKGSCVTCIEAPSEPGPGCGDELATCRELEPCKATMECADQAGCFDLPSVPDIVSCGIECGEQFGIATDPDSLAAGTALFSCIIGPCNGLCGAADASSGDGGPP